MNAISHEFENLINSSLIYIQNIYLNKQFQEFSFHFLIEKKNDFITQLLQQNIRLKTIVINEHIDSMSQYEIGDDFFIVSFNTNFIIIPKSEISQLFPFFIQNQDSMISCTSKTAKDDIQSLIEPQLQNFSSDENENNNFSQEIQSFATKISIKIKDTKVSSGLNNFLKELKKSIAALLIKKSYVRSKIFQFYQKHQIFKQKKISENNINSDEYIVLRNISRGLFSYIDLIYIIEIEQLFALKVFYDEAEKIKLFNREHSNYLNIHHRFIPVYLGTTIIDSTQCLIMQYLEGKTLNEIQNIVSNENKIKIIFKIMTILEYLHYKEYVYRDMKPNNFIVDEFGSIYLIDFDEMINKPLNSCDNCEFTTNFSSNFIAPEIVQKQDFSNKADIYSLGKIIYFLFSEKIPKEYEILDKICKKCTIIDESKRPSISQLIKEFYLNFHEIISNVSEVETIISTKDIHTEKFIPYWIYITESDNPVYLFQLGNMYERGRYVKPDVNKAIQYYTLSADMNYVDAQFKLGTIYYVGQYIERDMNKSIKYFSLASEQNHLDSQFQLGIFYFEGKYIKQNIDKAIEYFTLAINQDHLLAHFYLGLIYYDEKYLKKDINKSIAHFKICAEQGFNEAQYYLGVLYYEGKYVEINIDKALEYLNESASHNNSEALYLLGEIYYENKYVKRDIYKSIEYFILASNQDNAKAQFKLGEIYYENKYIERDIDKSIEFFVLAAEQNNPIAQYNLGSIYYSGQFVPQNIALAIAYFLLSANQNNVLAQYNLGQIYYQGKGVIKDLEKSIHFFTLAADQNYSEAQNELGAIYFENKHINKAINYFILAANQNHPIAQFNLGLLYFKGKYIQADINKAIEYLTLSAKQNYLLAQYYLGLIYYDNIKDLDKSVEFFTSSSLQNHLDSHFYLGLIYINKKYTHHDVSKAIYYFTQAANQGHLNAQYSLGVLYYEGNYVTRDIDKSIWYFSLASNQDSSEAQNFLGSIYYEGYYVPRNIEKAIHYFELASKFNNSNAQFNLGLLYYENKFIKQDINKAIHYFLLASNVNPFAQNYLGVIYYENKYIQRDINKSIYYFKLAARNNYSNAQYNLGLIYYQNKYVPININKAIHYFLLAQKNMFYKASLYLGYIYHEGKYIEKDIEKAISFYKEASSFNDQFAKNNLGVIYKNGFETKVIKNLELSKEYFHEAIHQKDDFISMFNLSNIYLDEENINEAIELLIKSSNKGFIPSKIVLFYLLAKDLERIDLKSIENEMKKYNKGWNIYAPKVFKWYNDIGQYLCDNVDSMKNAYNYFRRTDVLFLNGFFIFSDIFEKNSNQQNIQNIDMALPINDDFYEGFGI